MPDSVVHITDAQLLAQLRASHIAPAQKTQLEALLPQMDEGEKAELSELINRSHEEYKKSSKAYAETIDGLAKEHSRTLREGDKGFRKELEGIEQSETAQNLKAIEAEVYTLEAKPEAKGRPKPKKHTIRTLFLILFFIGLLAGGALYALSVLQ